MSIVSFPLLHLFILVFGMVSIRRHLHRGPGPFYLFLTVTFISGLCLLHLIQNPLMPPPPPPLPSCSLTLALILCHAESSTPSSSPLIASSFTRQINQTLVLLKSLALQILASPSPSCVSIFILASTPTHFDLLVHSATSLTPAPLFNFSYIPVHYPKGVDAGMASWFRPCATLRLFLPALLPPSVTSLLYLDTDFIFLQHPARLMEWVDRKEHNFASNKSAAMSPCLFHYGSPANKVPFYGGSGLNAGLMVMNIKRMRESGWMEKVRLIAELYSTKLRLADQDILNIFFHFFPEEVLELGCDWNWRPFQCRPGSMCNMTSVTSTSGGISALHGNALSFTVDGTEPLFARVFQSFAELDLTSTSSGHFRVVDVEAWLDELEIGLFATEEKFRASHCAKMGDFSTFVLQTLRQSLVPLTKE